MLTTLKLENFKGFHKYQVEFERLNLLVGGNNSGKTTIFHALQLAFWCIEQTVDLSQDSVTFRKTQVPEVGAVPYFAARDLFYRQQQRIGKRPSRIRLSIASDSTPELHFEIYTAFSRNLMVDGSDQTLTRQQYDTLANMKPVYVPGTIGITVREEFLRVISQERLISEGRQNQVLRNLVYRLRRSDEWSHFVQVVTPLFELSGLDVPFDPDKDEWLNAVYEEENRCKFDFVSAGSGFLQVINLLSVLYLNESKVALLDEPDSHMHDDLQRLTFDLLDELSLRRRIQLIVATHSPTFIDAAGLPNILLIDRMQNSPLRAHDVETLVPMLGDRGLSLPPAKVMNTLKSRKCLFVEGVEADYQDFIERLGEIFSPGFRAITRGLTVFETGGATKKWPFDAIDCFQTLLGAPMSYIYISDRDFLTDDEVAKREATGRESGRNIRHLKWRHRESYLLEVNVLSRLLGTRWSTKHPDVAVPSELTAAGLLSFILEQARAMEDDTRTTLTVEHELALRGDQEHRKKGLTGLNEYFRVAYTESLEGGNVPLKLLDAKQVLKNLRSHIAQQYSISFSDRDILASYHRDEIPGDLNAILTQVLGLFNQTPTQNTEIPAPEQTCEENEVIRQEGQLMKNPSEPNDDTLRQTTQEEVSHGQSLRQSWLPGIE